MLGWVLLTRRLLRWVLLTRLLRWIRLTRLLLARLLRWIRLTRLLLARLLRWIRLTRLLRWIRLIRISGRHVLRWPSRVCRTWRDGRWLLLAQRQPENACQQQHTANNEADDGSRPQGVPDPTQITKAGHVDNDDLSRVARAVVGRHGVADLRWPATRDCALASLCLALGVGVADRDDRRAGLIN